MHFDRMSVIIYVQEGAVNVMKYFCCLLSSGAKQRATGDNEVYTATLHFFFFLAAKPFNYLAGATLEIISGCFVLSHILSYSF